MINFICLNKKAERVKKRDVAQFGSAHGLGPWGREFKSHHPEVRL